MGAITSIYAHKESAKSAARLAIQMMPSALAFQAGITQATSPSAAGFSYDDDGNQIDYYCVGDVIGTDGARIAPSR
jgi:hypothetical protein